MAALESQVRNLSQIFDQNFLVLRSVISSVDARTLIQARIAADIFAKKAYSSGFDADGYPILDIQKYVTEFELCVYVLPAIAKLGVDYEAAAEQSVDAYRDDPDTFVFGGGG